MRLLFVSTLLATLLLVTAKGSNPLGPDQITSFVTFGDSYTDIVSKGDGPDAQAWPVYLSGYTNTTLFPFAKSGATCSNNLTFRPFPPLFESQLPAYFDFLANETSPKVGGNDTVFTLWIGTNDLGVSALLTGDAEIRVPGVSLVDVTQCMVNWVKVLYQQGNARVFLFQNMIPLEHVILYAPDSYPNRFWPGLPRNTTQWSLQMDEMVKSGNALTKGMLRELIADGELEGASIAYFDSHALFTDILNHPDQYLNGTAPLNTTGCINSCVFDTPTSTGDCTVVPEGPERDSFLWFDELHPSEQADRVVAMEIAKVFKGEESRWTTWLS
ncbi:carbohydrate esterase family 16 protein [Dendrothele bispora CBS 962.96]|uniref:Carbohydrate esterase family 16 protein n=1 Tax=Dendrothele bispora (strain CBS 962.96) TaxID=1314807 RepID=A0A4S8LZC3_DENBC|nr:carbohydrate esterase family 16 protein [Dendrothele bispora CBS 962.96]